MLNVVHQDIHVLYKVYFIYTYIYIKSNNLLDEVAKPDVIEYDIVSINTQVNIAQQSQAYGIPEPPPTSGQHLRWII